MHGQPHIRFIVKLL